MAADEVASAMPAAKLAALLRDLTQGDLLTLGAVTIVGRGQTPAVTRAGGKARAKDIWSVTMENPLGWYAIVSGACDIFRDPRIEPCIAVAPITSVTKERYQQLRSGEYSPREFPLPARDLAKIICAVDTGGFWPIVDLRYVTSVDKTALLNAKVESRRPLTGPQQKRFSTWVGRRYNRPAHSDQLEQHVLGKAGAKISKLAVQFAKSTTRATASPEVLLVGAAREWLIGGSERHIEINVVIDVKSAQSVGMYDSTNNEINGPQVRSAAGKLAKVLAATMPADSGYVLTVKPITLDGINAGEYLALEPWLWADADDPLGE